MARTGVFCILFCAAVLLAQPSEAQARSKAKRVYRTIHVKTARDYWRFHKQMSFANFVVVDLRSKKAFYRGRIPGAKNIVADKRIRFKLAKLKRQKAVMVYSQNGRLGKRVLGMMKKLRFREVYNIADGFTAWMRKKYPTKSGADD